MSAEPAITFVLYSEDGADAKNDFAALREVLFGMLRHVCPAVKSNHVEVLPVQPVRSARISGSHWKQRERGRPGEKALRRELIRAVATELKLGRVVFFHVDADEVYLERETCASLVEHWPRFKRDVAAMLATADDLDGALILAMPFFEMESWAFANVTYLRRVLALPGDLAQLARWAEDLRELDEIADIKDVLSIGGAHNHALFQAKHGFSPAALVRADKSYARTVERLAESRVVTGGLKAAASRPY
ncbi:MAG: hypothetical protein JNL82_16920 [Myxococcales bacterium]|nr:hypothetical protein [Myxococcales bacterium]